MAEIVRRCRPLLGTFVEIGSDREEAIDSAFAEIEQLHALMSAHDAGSDIARINRLAHDHPVAVDRRTAMVLERALHWSRESEGAFDVVAAGAWALACGAIPRHSGQPLPKAGHWTWLEVEGCSVRLHKPGCVDVGGIAKGFAVDRAVAALKAAGASAGLVNAGGDVAAFGPAPWPVQVVDPTRRRALANVAIQNGALATSALLPGGSARHLPTRAAHLVSATVCAPCAMDADALTKIVLAGSPLANTCLASALADAFAVTAAGDVCRFETERKAA